MSKVLLTLTVVGIFWFSFSGCYNDNYEDLYTVPGTTCDTSNVTYTNTLKAIVDAQCATTSCHAGPVPSGYDLSTYAGLKTVADANKLMPAINHTGNFPMPQGQPKLDDCTIAKFQAWVNNNEPQ